MSTIDNRIVKMEFDNAQFEAGVARSMSTLDKLNEKLQFKDAEKSASALQKIFGKVDISGIEASLDKLNARFSTLGIAGMEVVKRITNSALDGLKSIEQATIGQIKSGGWSRAMNLANAQFTIEGLKMDWNEMLKAINYGVQDTAYGLDSAAKAAASLAASGVAYQESVENANDSLMHTSLRAISGVAAMTNSSYDDIANVFTKVAGNGRLMGDDLQRLSSRGMNAAATLAEAFNTTEAAIRDAVSSGDISFKMFAEAMDSAFGEHAKEANKTFQGALSNMKAALSRIGAIFATPVINKTNVLFIALKSRIGEVQKALSDLTEEYEENGKTLKRTIEERFATHFAEAWEAAMNAAVAMVEAVDLSWVQSIADAMDNAAQKATVFFNKITDFFGKAEEETKEFATVADISVSDTMAAFDVLFNGKYGNGKARVKALEAAGHDAEKVQKFIDEFVKSGYKIDKLTMTVAGTSAEDLAKYFDEISKNGYKLTQTNTKLGQSIDGVSDSASKAYKPIDQIIKEAKETQTIKNFIDSASYIKDIFIDLSSAAVSFLKAIYNSYKKYIDPFATSDTLVNFLGGIHENVVGLIDFWSRFEDGIDTVTNTLENYTTYAASAVSSTTELVQHGGDILDTLDRWTGVKFVIDNLAASLNHMAAVGKNVAKAAFNIGKAIFKAFTNVFNPVDASSNIEGLTGSFENLSEGLVKLSEKIAPAVEGAFMVIFSSIQSISSIISKTVTGITNFVAGLLKGKDAITQTSEATEESVGIFDLLLIGFDKLASGISKVPDLLTELFDKLSQNEGVIRLKTAVSDLWRIMKDSVKSALDPFSDALGDISDEAGSASALDAVVKVIGWIADKLAGIIEKIPGWITTIENFAKTVKEKVIGAVDAISDRIDKFKKDHPSIEAATQLTDEGVEAVVDESKFAKILERIKNFAKDMGKAIKDGLSSVDWKQVAGIGLLISGIMEFYKLTQLTEDFRAIPKSISGVFKSISGVGKAISGFFKEAGQLTKYAAIAGIIHAISVALLILVGSVYILGNMDEDKLHKGIAAVAIIGGLIALLIWLATKLAAAKKVSTTIGKGAQSILSNFRIGLSAIGEIALLLFAVGSAIYLFTKAVKALDDVKNLAANTAVVVGILLLLTAFILIVEKVSRDLIKGTKDKNKLASVLLSVSLLLAVLGGVILTIAASIKMLSTIPSQGALWSSVGAIGLMLIVLMAAVGVISNSMKGKNVKQYLGVSLMIFVLGLVVAGIAASVSLLAAEFALLLKTSVGFGAIALAVGSIVALILTVGLAVDLIAKAVAGVKNPEKISGIILSMLAFVAVTAIALGGLAIVAGKEDSNLAGAVIGLLLVILSIAAILGIFAVVMKKQKITSKELIDIALAFVAMAGALLLFAAAMAVLTNVIASNPDAFNKAALAMAVFFAAFAVIAAVLAVAGDGFADSFLKIGAGFALAGAAALMLGLGMMAISQALLMIVPILPVLITNVDAFFTVLSQHLPVLVVLAAIVVVIIIAVMKAVEVVAPLLKGLLEVVTVAFKGIFELLSAGAKKFGAWFSELKPKTKAIIVSLIVAMCAALAESGPTVLQTIGTLILLILDWAIKGIPKLVDKLVLLIISLLDALGDSIRAHQNRIAAALWGIVGTLISLAATVIKQGLALLLGEKVAGGLSKVLGLDAGAKQIEENIKNMRAEAELADAEIQAIQEGRETYENPIDAKEWMSNFKYLDMVTNPGSALGFAAGKAAADAANEKMDKYDHDANTNVIKDYTHLGDTYGAAMGNGVTNGCTDNIDTDKIASAMHGAGDAGFNSFLSGAVNPDGSTYAANENIDAMLAQYTSNDTQNEMRDATGIGFVQPTKEELEQLGVDANILAKMAADGVFNGFWDSRQSFWDMIHNNYGVVPVKQLEKDWNISSPSKVFFKIASFAVQGLANGFTQNAGLVENATTTLSDQVIDSFTTPLEYIGALANGDLQYDPSIRPVLDSSNIAAGAVGINDMFANQNVTLSGLSGQLAADIGQLQSDNAEVVDELTALREDMAAMTEQMTNLKIVMNSGALVGAIAGDMDSALGQRTVYKRRGN